MKKTGLRVSFLSALITLMAVMMLATVLVVGVSAANAEWDIDNIEIKSGETFWDKGDLVAGADGSGVDYALSVDYAISSVTVKIGAKDGGTAVVSVGGTVAANGVVNLKAGEATKVNVAVTCSDGRHTTTYTLEISRRANSALSGLSVEKQEIYYKVIASYDGVESEVIVKGFNKDKFDYFVLVPYSVNSIKIEATAADSAAKVTVAGFNGADASELSVGSNVFTIIVENGSGKFASKTVYTLTATRQGNTALESMTVTGSDGKDYSPKVESGTTEYVVKVPFAVTSVNIGAKAASSNALLTVVGGAEKKDLVVGDNGPYTIMVSYGGGEAQTQTSYTVKIVRAFDTRLVSLQISDGVLLQADGSSFNETGKSGFDTDVYYYVIEVPYSVTELEVTSTCVDFLRVSVQREGFTSLSVGNNIAKITLTDSRDPSVTSVYNFKIVRDDTANDNARLSEVVVMDSERNEYVMQHLYNSVDPSVSGFQVDVYGYLVRIPYSVPNLSFELEMVHSYATVSAKCKMAGATAYKDLTVKELTGGKFTIAMDEIPEGRSEVIITVTAEDGETSRSYTVTVVRRLSDALLHDDASLSGLDIGYTLYQNSNMTTEGFASAVLNYYATVPYDVTTLNVIPTTTSGNAVYSIVGADNLKVGENSIFIYVYADKFTADNNCWKIYTVTVTRKGEPSHDAALKDLKLTLGENLLALTPAFSKDVTNYAVTVDNAYTEITVTATATHSAATVVVSGNTNLAVGANTIAITVTAEDGTTTKTYYITATRRQEETKSSDATLSSLTISGVTLSPAFTSDTKLYSGTVANNVTSVPVVATTTDAKATFTISGNTGLEVGSNTITVMVTAEDGKTFASYIVYLTRAEEGQDPGTNPDNPGQNPDNPGQNPDNPGQNPDNPGTNPDDPTAGKDASLKALKLTNVTTGEVITLSPIFSGDVLEYVATTSFCTSVKVSATLSENGAIWMLGAGSGSTFTDLKVGENTLKIIVRSADREEKQTYTVVLTIEQGSGTPNPGPDVPGPDVSSTDATLSSITVNGAVANLSPMFNASVLQYTMTVPYDMNSIAISGVASAAGATVTNRQYNLNEGNNVVSVEVTAPDKVTKQTYTITVYRTPNVKTLSGVLVIAGTTKVGETLTATFVTADAGATAEYHWYINGAEVATGATYVLTENDAGKSVMVTAVGTGSYTGTISSEAALVEELPADTDQDPADSDDDKDDKDDDKKQNDGGIPTIVIILIAVGCVGIIAAFALFFLRGGKKRR